MIDTATPPASTRPSTGLQGRPLILAMIVAAALGIALTLLQLSQTFPGSLGDVAIAPQAIVLFLLFAVLSAGLVFLARHVLTSPLRLLAAFVLVVALPALVKADINLATTITGEAPDDDAGFRSIPLNPARAVYNVVADPLWNGLEKKAGRVRGREVDRLVKAYTDEADLERLKTEFLSLVAASDLPKKRKDEQTRWVTELMADEDQELRRKVRSIGSRIYEHFGRDALRRLAAEGG